jgi:sphinganine-1-phosphate aldolase
MLFTLSLPPARNKVESELARAKKTIEDSLAPRGPEYSRHVALPIEGHTPEWIEAEMAKMDGEQHGADWKGGRCSGAVYREPMSALVFSILIYRIDGGEDLEKVLVSAFARYTVSNPLHPDAFPCKSLFKPIL